MYINQIDNFFDNILDNFLNYLLTNHIFDKFNKDTNFVKYQTLILETIKKFIDSISIDSIIKIIKDKQYLEFIINVIKRYCAFYIYLGIGYYYKGTRELFTINLLECSKFQKNSTIQINNFFNSDNNSKIITYFNDITNIKALADYKTIDKVKIILKNNPTKFESTIKLFNDLGEDYVINNFLIKDNFHAIIKTLIFKQIYINEEKHEINELFTQIEEIGAEYKYIEIIVSSAYKIVDFNILRSFLNFKQLKEGLAEEIYSYLEEIKNTNENIIKENEDFINYLFNNKILVPITEEFLRYHKDSEKYEISSNIDKKKREETKIKYLLTKITNVKNFYSDIIEKNQKLKLEIKNNFYRNMENRVVVLYNDDEEIKIIQKLEYSDNQIDNDNLMDLIDLRKYAYVNFKHMSNDYIKLRTLNTIDAIRYINLDKKKNELLEIRVGHDNNDLNVVGVAWNPSRLNMTKTPNLRPLECFKCGDLINANKLFKSDNGFTSFIKSIKKTIYNKNSKLYYWIFNTKKDIPSKSLEYLDFNINNTEKTIKLLLYEIYKLYIDFVKLKFKKYITNIKSNLSLWNLEYLLKVYQQKYFDFELNPSIINQLINEIIKEKVIEIEVTEDETINIIPGMQNKIIKLPTLIIEENKKNIIIVNYDKINKPQEDLEINNFAICNHYIKWNYISKQSKNKKENYSQLIFEFIKKYLKINEQGDFICKSCYEMLPLKKFVKDPTYNKEEETFMTTSIIVNQKLENIPEYINLKKTIDNLGKILEKIAYTSNLLFYLGNTPIVQLNKKMVIKNVIDLIHIHTVYLKKQPKNRMNISETNYNISKNLTNLFFFELKDEIFLTSSTDTDYFKIIKYNNIIAYLIFIIISELNSGQILNLKEDKQCTHFFYSKVGQQLFEGLFLRINESEKIQLSKIPLLAYSLFYFSCILTSKKIWLWNDTDSDKKDLFNINIQKSIIHTVIDLMNTLVEANLEANKNYLYELLNTRFTIKLKNIFNDTALLKRIENNSLKNIKIDTVSKKVSIIKNKIEYLKLNIPNNYFIENNIQYCVVSKFKLRHRKEEKHLNKIDAFTNCDNGKFHKWISTNGYLQCSLCDKKYDNIIKEFDTTTESDTKKLNYYEQIKLIQILKLTHKYCLDGKMHKLDPTTSICSLCNINSSIYKYTKTELLNLYLILEKKENFDIVQKFEKIKNEKKNYIDTENYKNLIEKKFLKRFDTDIIKKYSSHQFINYITDFIDKLITILGPKIKINNKTIYLKETVYTIDHDYLGNATSTKFIIFDSSDIIKTHLNHPILKKDIIYYKDKINNMYVYYDIVTLQYLGYSDNNINIKKNNNNNVTLNKELSIKDSILLLGLENKYTNINHFDINTINNSNIDLNEIVNNLLRTRLINIKQIISKVESIINSVRNHSKINRIYNIEENKIINEFTKKLKQFNMSDENGHNNVFKHSQYINNQINIQKIYGTLNFNIINNNYINSTNLNNINNADIKLLYYLIMNLNRIIDYNTQPVIQSELCNLIIHILLYVLQLYYKDYDNAQLRKFDYLLMTDTPYKDENIRLVGLYSELINAQEIDTNEIKNNNYDAQEAKDSLDIDDYEIDDDIDGSAGALDGYEPE